MGRSLVFLVLALFALSALVFGQDVPTLIPPVDFDPVADADRLNRALSGIGTNEDAIIDVFCYRSFEQRAIVVDTYYTNHGNLLLDLQNDLRGEFLDFTTKLTYNKGTFLSIEFHNAIAGFGVNEPTMTEIIITRKNQELADMQVAYQTYYGTPLTAAIEGEVSGSLRDLYVMLVQGSRDEGTEVDSALVSRDVQNLYNSGEGSLTTNEKTFVDILGSRNWLHIQAVANEYDATYGSLENAIVTEFNNVDAENALCTIVRYSRNKAAYFANRFYVALDGVGTANTDLDRLAIARCETDLGNIKTEYESIYRIPLSEAIKSDTAGSHQNGLLALLG